MVSSREPARLSRSIYPPKLKSKILQPGADFPNKKHGQTEEPKTIDVRRRKRQIQWSCSRRGAIGLPKFHENLNAIVVLESCDPRGIMSVGICKLCLEEKELHDSHLIPKGVYKSLRSEGEDAISVTATKILQISWQFHAHLLCRSCEDRLNKGGETWVLKHMARQIPRPQFLLFDLLNESALCEADDDGRVYASAELPQIDTAKLAYFALSMFWRTTIHEWKGIDGFTRRLSLGSYAEPVRQFLLRGRRPKY